MPIQAVSAPNIALIKYWGNRNDGLRLAAAASLSMTLDSPLVTVSVDGSDEFSVQSFDATGIEMPQSAGSVARLKRHWELSREYLLQIQSSRNVPENMSLTIRSEIPPSVGLASSAAVFSALAVAYAGFGEGSVTIKPEDVSVLARLGSGSAARSVFGGFAALESSGDGIDGAKARLIAPETHWNLHDIVIIPSRLEKKVGSTEGHAKASTSHFFADRIAAIPGRMKECIEAIETKDFARLQRVSEEDSLDMHRVMQTQKPPLDYLSDETRRILREIEPLREKESLDVLCTMDAGPTVHLICTAECSPRIIEYAEAQKNCTVFRTKIGRGAHIVH